MLFPPSVNILELQLNASDLRALTHFYGSVLGFSVLESSNEMVKFQAGTTSISFSPSLVAFPSTYHFAFDVPENQLEDAKAWLGPRVRLLTDENGNDTFHFEN